MMARKKRFTEKVGASAVSAQNAAANIFRRSAKGPDIIESKANNWLDVAVGRGKSCRYSSSSEEGRKQIIAAVASEDIANFFASVVEKTRKMELPPRIEAEIYRWIAESMCERNMPNEANRAVFEMAIEAAKKIRGYSIRFYSQMCATVGERYHLRDGREDQLGFIRNAMEKAGLDATITYRARQPDSEEAYCLMRSIKNKIDCDGRYRRWFPGQPNPGLLSVSDLKKLLGDGNETN